MRAGITGALEFQEKMIMAGVVEFCDQKGLCVGPYFEQMVKGQDGVGVKSMVDLVLVKKDMLRYMQDMRVMRGIGRGFSDHNVVLCKVRLVGAWTNRREVVVGA